MHCHCSLNQRRFNFWHLLFKFFSSQRKAFEVWRKNPHITILGNNNARRLPIFSMLIRHEDSGKMLHHNFVSVLLNDLYGIQARGGCACAGPYAQVRNNYIEEFEKAFSILSNKHCWYLHSTVLTPLTITRCSTDSGSEAEN